jgi:DNA-binding response OmpR family regulator
MDRRTAKVLGRWLERPAEYGGGCGAGLRAPAFLEKSEIFRNRVVWLRALNLPASVEFGRFRVLPHRPELLMDGQPAKLGRRAFDVLVTLIETRGAVVSKDALTQGARFLTPRK